MKLRLQNTSYVDFDSWLRLRVTGMGFDITYDPDGFIEDKNELNFIPQGIKP